MRALLAGEQSINQASQEQDEPQLDLYMPNGSDAEDLTIDVAQNETAPLHPNSKSQSSNIPDNLKRSL